MEVKIQRVNGRNTIVIDGKPMETLAFKSFRPTLRNVTDFRDAGIKLYHVIVSGLTTRMAISYSRFGEIWEGENKYNFDNLDAQIELILKNAPDAYVMLNIHLDSRPWWHEQNPGRNSSFTNLSQIAADEKWRKDTAEYLKALIRHAEEKYNDKVCGYFLLGGCYTEWLSEYDFQETHPIKLKAFREYMKDDTIEIPTKEELEGNKEIFVDPIKDAKLIAYQKFHNELISDTVLYYAHAAQEVLNHTKPVGVFFGYILELWRERLWNCGHIDADRVYRNDDIDFYATPSSYQFRCHDQASAYMLMTDTLDLNDRMYFLSFDHLTFMVSQLDNLPGRTYYEQGWLKALLGMGRPDLMKTREETIDVLRREYMQAVAKGTGHWWFDMAEGWFYDKGLMDEITNIISKANTLTDVYRESNSEIAVFVSCESMYYVNKMSDINSEVILNQRDALSRIGAPFDCYSLNDINRIDLDKYKLCIFLDAYYLTEEQREIINNRVKANGRTCLFIGACDYINDSGVSHERIENMAEMKLEQIRDENRIETETSGYGYETMINPVWAVADDSVEKLGYFSGNKKCGLAKKASADHTVYFSALGNISHEVLREIAREAGVHIYAENGTPVYVNSGFVGVYNPHDAETEVTLPVDGIFTELFTGKTYESVNGKVVLPTGESAGLMLVLNDGKKGIIERNQLWKK